MLNGTEMIRIEYGKGPKNQELLNKKQKFVSKGISNAFPIFVDEATLDAECTVWSIFISFLKQRLILIIVGARAYYIGGSM